MNQGYKLINVDYGSNGSTTSSANSGIMTASGNTLRLGSIFYLAFLEVQVV